MSDTKHKPWRVSWECKHDGCERGICDETFATKAEAQAFADAESALLGKHGRG